MHDRKPNLTRESCVSMIISKNGAVVAAARISVYDDFVIAYGPRLIEILPPQKDGPGGATMFKATERFIPLNVITAIDIIELKEMDVNTKQMYEALTGLCLGGELNKEKKSKMVPVIDVGGHA